MASRGASAHCESDQELPVMLPGQTYAGVTQEICEIALAPPGIRWWIGFLASLLLILVLLGSLSYLFIGGVGIWGINTTVVWGFAIINYVWWIGIGNAGTLISAMLYLTRQPWRTTINRFAEAMTIIAASIAGIFPILHLGRPYVFFWLIPYPNVMGVWPQFRSPLMWDMFAILTYILVSILFWYMGMIPDFATLRDRARNRSRQLAYGMLALGWRGSARHWERYETSYRILAGLAVPLVISVHSVVGYDFSVSVMPGWESTIFSPYFVVGAMFSGFAMVITITAVLRQAFKLHGLVTLRHFDVMAKILLTGSLIMGYSYGMEAFMAWYSGDLYDLEAVRTLFSGPYAPAYGVMLFCNVIVPQLCWSPCIRRNVAALLVISVLVNVGMWLERYLIVVKTLGEGFLPSQSRPYFPTVWDWAVLIGMFGVFVAAFHLFVRFIPMIAMHETKKLIQARGIVR